AVSREMTLENIALWAGKKGIQIMGTGDFTHPQWFNEIKTKLEPAEQGLYKLQDTRFMLTTEISSIYSKAGKVRKIHNLIFAPSIEAVEKINTKLGWIGNLKSDGRPILGLDSKELLKIILNIDSQCVLVPAHAWTPWFSIFGSMSGFDTIEECFDELSPHIFAIETGLSSDPAMNWMISALDKISLISNSDSHSLQKIGREANVFECEFSYSAIIDAIKSRDPKKFLYTTEFFPEEGRYHYDGHRLCGISMSPEETKKNNGICPVCNKKMTIGTMSRIDKLADRPVGGGRENKIPFKSLIPLDEIIADVYGVGVASKAVKKDYENLVKNIGTEFNVLLEASYEDLNKATSPEIASGIMAVREGRVELIPGYDGEYGKIKIFKDKKEKTNQPKLF
ncbi:MAG: endonuclease Q family protein, partial [Candidatus Parcubacteria bacterium]|nr:endonuclease Q family protein [Candidatus Parcubacteria bacterium]